jgi:hypothetical protein
METLTRLLIVTLTLICGTLLTLVPMLFAKSGAHPDYIGYAQLAGFLLLGAGVILGFRALRGGAK